MAFKQFLLSIYYIPDTVLGTEDKLVTRSGKFLALREFWVLFVYSALNLQLSHILSK